MPNLDDEIKYLRQEMAMLRSTMILLTSQIKFLSDKMDKGGF